MSVKKNRHHFNEIKPFDFDINYTVIDVNSPENVFDSHIHEECEIYINISGDVSFVVENRIYPVMPGEIIITRPYEYHHCVYHSNKLHKHFWILFSANGNEDFLDIFYNRKLGEGNLLTLSPKETETIISLCHEMTENKNVNHISKTAGDEGKATNYESKMYYRFFKLLDLLQNADITRSDEETYPSDIVYAISYINRNFAHQISIGDIAKEANVSVNTLERHFSQFFNSTPSVYIRKKRLANAAKLLAEGCTVAEASANSGFFDYSHFIALFKKSYGITPLKYKKRQEK